jgi:predicted small secreted protein
MSIKSLRSSRSDARTRRRRLTPVFVIVALAGAVLAACGSIQTAGTDAGGHGGSAAGAVGEAG